MKKISKPMVILFFVLLQGCFSSKYELDFGEDEERGIRDTATGELIVAPAVIGFESEEEHYFGYRLPKQDVRCHRNKAGRNYSFTIARLDLEPVFFSLSLETGLLTEFTDRAKFKEHLHSNSIDLGNRFDDIGNSSFVLHYKKIYKEYDLFNCSSVD